MKTDTTPDPFIKKIIEACDDRGTRAELRRYWSPTTRHYAYPHLGHLQALGEHKKPDAYIAALYAVHPNHSYGPNLGSACRKLAGDKGFDSFERHFRRLLASESLDDVADQLYRIFKRMERESIPLDYEKLLWNLRSWNKKSEDVKTNWAMGFWNAPEVLSTDSES
jgi:CRISPR type I-E-associated protein CasB/Cse2